MPDGNVLTSSPPAFVAAPLIIGVVAATLGVSVEDVTGKRVLAGLVAARQIAALLCAEFTLLSMVEIGFALGRRDNSTGRYILLEARARLEKDQCFAEAFQQARQGLAQVNH